MNEGMLRAAFIRHVMTLMSGKMASQVFALALVPIVARLFEPAAFGVMAIFVTVTHLLAIVAPLRYFRASLLTPNDEHARILLAMSAWLLIAGCVLVLVIVVIERLGGFTIAFLDPVGGFVWLIPLGMFLHGLDQILATDHTRRMTFRQVAMADVGQPLLMGSSRILFGLGGSSVWGLIAGYFIGSAGRVLLLSTKNLNPISLLRIRVPWLKAKELALEYREYPLHSTPAGLVVFLAGKIPILVMAIMFTPAAVGCYAMADRLVRLPMLAAGTSIREVFIRKLTGNINSGIGLRRPLAILTLGMFLLGIAPFGILAYFGTEILAIVLGENWVDAGVYVQILAPWYYAVWVSTGVQPTLVALRRQGLWLWIQLTMLVMRLTVFGLGYIVAADVEATLQWFSFVNVVIALLLLAFTFYLLNRHQNNDKPK